MLDLTAPEIKALLWCSHVVDLAYGHGPPEGFTIDSARQKLLEGLARDKARKAYDAKHKDQVVCVVRQGTGWP